MKAFRLLLIAALLVVGAHSGFAADKALPTPNRGTVAETIETTDYTYIRVNSAKGGEVWLAAPQQALPVGTAIAWSDGASMSNFKSMRLNRTFNAISFVDVVVKTK
ncbi:MAG: hypothetical protein H7Z12_19780 [Rhodospirillaceae bacterium]|nr:hypothetical protein [Rhodospirillales bacterium]